MKQDQSLIPSQDELSMYQLMAKKATDSQLFNKIGGEAGLLSIMLMARELGLPAFQAIMGGMNVIQGKVELSPRLMNSMIRKAGHKIEIIENTDQVCKLKGIRHDTAEEYPCSYSMDDAKRANLVRAGSGWEKYPSDMLFARCLSRLARRLFADVISNTYVEGEIMEAGKAPVEEDSHKTLEAAQKSTTEVDGDKLEHEAEITEKKPPEMSLDEFRQKVHEKVGDKYSLIAINHYLEHLEKEKAVSQAKIMEQALNPVLIERFCRGWKSWYDAYAKQSEETIDRM